MKGKKFYVYDNDDGDHIISTKEGNENGSTILLNDNIEWMHMYIYICMYMYNTNIYNIQTMLSMRRWHFSIAMRFSTDFFHQSLFSLLYLSLSLSVCADPTFGVVVFSYMDIYLVRLLVQNFRFIFSLLCSVLFRWTVTLWM